MLSNKLSLSGVDLKDLRRSGLTDKTIRENQIYTEYDSAKVAEILNCSSGTDRCINGLVFPYRTLAGKVNCFARVKPLAPRVRDGKEVKYEQPAGAPPRAYFPAASLDGLNDGKADIYITEGEKKALALAQLGLATIGLGGVWCGLKKDSNELIDDLAEVQFRGRRVYIVFDYDEKPKTRGHVAEAMRRLAKAIRAAGAKEVYCVVLPPGPNDTKCGVDDFLVAQGEKGKSAFMKLVRSAEPVPDAVVASITKPSGRTDTANAARLIAKFGELVRWIGPWDKWLIWDGQRWHIDQTLRIEDRAKQIAKAQWKEIAATVSKGSTDKDTIKAMVAFAKLSNSANGVRNMVALARSEPGVSISTDKLDADPLLLNVCNGTLDLRTGALREHRREDFITKLAPVTFDPDAECPLWLAFLEKIFDDRAPLIEYMQRLVGYCLTGETSEHVLPFLFGAGANGKSTFAEILLKLLGPDYGMKASPDLLLAKRGESHPTERADLFGKRLVACIETEDGRRLAESLVKELTGGDRIRARRMREDFWEFAPTHHVWLAGNYKPTIRGTDHGIWRRVKLIPFDVTIPEPEQDKKLPAKLAGELPGILNWALKGCLDWQGNGMQEPEIVRAATREYSNEMDEVGQFIDERCELGADFLAPATDLYMAFQKEMPSSEMSQQSFGAALRRRGLENERITKGHYKAKKGWRGLKLRTIDIKELKESIKRRTTEES